MTRKFIQQHFDKAVQRGWVPYFAAASVQYDFPLALLMALASRETNMTNMLGDKRYNARLGKVVYNGYGILQVDINTDEEWCLSGKWKDTGSAILHGTKILDGKRSELNRRWQGSRTLANFLWVLAASYNHGTAGSYKDFVESGNPDRGTTGHDYGADVIGRMKEFQALLDADGIKAKQSETHPLYDPALQPNTPAAVALPAAPAAPDTPPPAINITGTDNQVDTGTTAPPVEGGGASDPKIPMSPSLTPKDGSTKSWLAAIGAAILAALTWLVTNIETAFNAAKNSFTDSPVATLSIICFFATILVIFWKYTDRQTQLDKQREQNAHEQTLANQQTLADPKKLNVIVEA